MAEGPAHPDMATTDSTTQIQPLGSGTIGMTSNAFTMWSVFNTRFGGSFPGVELHGLRVPKGAGGGLASMFGGTGYYTMTRITQAVGDDERFKEILHVLDYLVAPFGTQESRHRPDPGIDPVFPDQGPVRPDRGQNIADQMVSIVLGR